MEDGEHTPQEVVKGVEVIRAAVRALPLSSGVYRMLNANGDALYVGKAKQLKNRVSHYTNLQQLPWRLQRMVSETVTLEHTLCSSEAEALLLEANQIKTLKPRYNILLRDDKSFPFIHVATDHPYPRISKYRGSKNVPGKFFGPFASAAAVNETLALLQKAFLLRPCSDNVFKNRSRPCLQYQIKRCSGPCVGIISQEKYAALVEEAQRFLSGKCRDIQDQLASDMMQASEQQDYERAAQLRDRLKALSQVRQDAPLATADIGDGDIIALARQANVCCVQLFCYRGGRYLGHRAYFPVHTEEKPDAEIISAFIGQFYQQHTPPALIYVSALPEEHDVLENALRLLADGVKVEIIFPQRGEKAQVVKRGQQVAEESLARHLEEKEHVGESLGRVAELFGLDAPPRRIEVYDNSHVMGAHAVGAMVVAGPEGFNKKAYRIYNIRNAEVKGDDYGMMREVLSRRFRNAGTSEEDATEDTNWPDLLLIDGGGGQLSAVHEALAQQGIEDVCVVAISKGPDRNAGREFFHMKDRAPFQLPLNDPTLHYLQRLRDEAHRFAIGAHRKKRSRDTLQSGLDAVPAIGGVRKKALLLHFGSAKGVAEAGVDELARVPGISRELARKIYDHFHS